MRIDGLIYMNPITDKPLVGHAKNIRMFSKLVGKESWSKVVLATTRWDQVQRAQEQAEVRAEESVHHLWLLRINDSTATAVYRLDGHKDSALRVVSALLPSDGQDKVKLQIQYELVDESRTLDETEAGKELAEDLRRRHESAQEDLEAMKSGVKSAFEKKDMETVRHILRKEDRLKLRMSQVEDEQNKLHMDFRRLKKDGMKRITSVIARTKIEMKEKIDHMGNVTSVLKRLHNEFESQSKSTYSIQ